MPNSNEAPRLRKKLKGIELSDEERRQVRSQQRSIQEQLANEAIHWTVARDENNAIFESNKVAYTRELVIDVENGKLALRGFAKEVESKVQVPRFDAQKLADRLSQQATSRSGFNWSALGSQIGVCFSAAPSGLSFLAGALEAEVRQRAKPKKRAKRTDDEPKEKVEETRPEEVTNNKSDGDKLSAMEKLNKKVKSCLERRTKEETKEGDETLPQLDAVRFLFNPNSFTQTVENIFTYSFLIKKGHGGIATDGDSLYVHTTGNSPNNPTRQSVCSFTMADFQLLKESRDRFDLPNRSTRVVN